jgi:hypothetical protein
MHASFATGLRPPSGFDLAFTNNPASARADPVFRRAAQTFGATASRSTPHFHNRFDLIVSLGGAWPG